MELTPHNSGQCPPCPGSALIRTRQKQVYPDTFWCLNTGTEPRRVDDISNVAPSTPTTAAHVHRSSRGKAGQREGRGGAEEGGSRQVLGHIGFVLLMNPIYRHRPAPDPHLAAPERNTALCRALRLLP